MTSVAHICDTGSHFEGLATTFQQTSLFFAFKSSLPTNIRLQNHLKPRALPSGSWNRFDFHHAGNDLVNLSTASLASMHLPDLHREHRSFWINLDLCARSQSIAHTSLPYDVICLFASLPVPIRLGDDELRLLRCRRQKTLLGALVVNRKYTQQPVWGGTLKVQYRAIRAMYVNISCQFS